MDINLRFGMHRDIEVIHSIKSEFDGLVIPAHILAYQSASTSVFITSLSSHPYIIDPMTYMFQGERSSLTKDDNTQLRPSIEKLSDIYHAELKGKLLRLPDGDKLSPDQYPNVRDTCKNVVAFQRKVVAEESTTSQAAKYLSRYGATLATKPRMLVSPYFRFQNVGDEFYELSKRCLQETISLKESGEHVAAVVLCPVDALSKVDSETIIKDFSSCSTVLIWPDNFKQTSVQKEQIQKVWRFINLLETNKIKSECLYGGYLLMLMHYAGLNSISHGILYSEHKSSQSTPGSGGAPERYYLPKFKEFRSLSQTDIILHQHPELMCECDVCQEVMGGDPDRIILFEDEPRLLREHFFSVRKNEAIQLPSKDLNTVLEEFRATHRDYHESVSSLPNPDTSKKASVQAGLDYLNTWADALASSGGTAEG